MTEPRYPFQEPTFLCADKQAVISLYGEPAFRRELYGEETTGKNRFANTIRLLGNPLVEGFAESNIVRVPLPGFGPNKSLSLEVEVHRKLKPLFQAAFEKIRQLKLPYVLHEAGGYFFRYQLNKSVQAALSNRPEYADLKDKPGGWNINFARRDLRNQAFDELIDYRGRKVEKKSLLSNHAFGSAIDINWATNDIGAENRFDMPRKVVKIFESLGFYWGGYYNDYMHFEYERSSIVGLSDELSPEVLFPFSEEQRRESPLKYYFLNEGGKGGFFPLGKQQNLHAGVHLEPDSPAPLVPVKAAMPGYIVAARLLTAGKEGDNKYLLSATEGRHLGFVLIRHELTEPESAASDRVHPLYSLYMHLAPPAWGSVETDKAFVQAPWLASFLKMQHGAVVNLDASADDVGRTFWAQEPLRSGAESYKVRERAQPLTGAKALTKPSPTDVREAIEALKKGSIITFDRPLFPVAAGETIGFLAPGRSVGDAAASATPPRYLHWELFSLSGDGGGLQFLTDRDAELKDLLRKVEEKDRQDNFLQMPSDGKPGANNDVHAILGSTGVDIVQKLRRAGYGRTLQEFFNDGRTFFSAQGTRETPFTWPLPLTLENKYGFAGDPEKPCTLEVLYTKAGQPLSQETFTLSPRKDQPTLTVTLSVPAAADALALWSPVFFADRVEVPANELREKRLQSRTELFKKAARHRWRDLVLDHVNEWTPTGLGKQLDARKEAGLFDHLEDDPEMTFEGLKQVLLPLCWWDRPATETDAFGEVPVLADAEGRKKSLFGTGDALLPKDPHVVNMHPVTALWLLDLLLEKEAIGLKKEWAPGTLKRDESTQEPPFLGLLTQEPTALAGMEMVAILVQHGYGTTEGANATDVTFWLTEKGRGSAGHESRVLLRAPYQEGVAFGRVRAPSWGQWEVHATDGNGQRFTPAQSQATTFELPKPALTGQPFELGSKAGKFRPLATGGFVVREHWPAALAGYIVFEYWKVPARAQPDLGVTPTSGSLAMPVLALRPPALRTAGGLKYKNDLIVGPEKKGGNPRVTANFTLKDFVQHPRLGKVFEGNTEDFMLAAPLAQRLQELRDLCKPKDSRTRDLPLLVKRLKRTGLSLLVIPASGKATDLERLAEKLPLLKPTDPPGLFSAERDDEEAAILLTYHRPRSSGPLHLEFDPGPALGRLAAEALSGETAGETLHVRPRFIAPSSGHALHASGKLAAVEGETDLFAASAEAIRAACGNDVLEVVADRCLPPVARFEFGDIQVKMGAGVLRTEVKLHGDATRWTAAAPVFKLAGTVQNKRSNGALLGDWPLLDRTGQRIPQMWSGPLQFSAEVVQPGKVATPPPPVTHTVEVQPSLERLTHALRGRSLCFTGQGHFIPTDLDFRIICEQQDAATGQWAEHAVITSAIRYTSRGDSPWGRCTETGLFEASVPHLLLKKAGGPFRFFWRRRVDRTGAPLPVLGAILEEPPPLELTVAELGL